MDEQKNIFILFKQEQMVWLQSAWTGYERYLGIFYKFSVSHKQKKTGLIIAFSISVLKRNFSMPASNSFLNEPALSFLLLKKLVPSGMLFIYHDSK